MDHDLCRAQKKVWKMLKNRKKQINEFVQTKGVTKDVWKKYFRKLYNTEEAVCIENYEINHQIIPNEEEVMPKIKNRPIMAFGIKTREKINKTKSMLRNNKAQKYNGKNKKRFN